MRDPDGQPDEIKQTHKTVIKEGKPSERAYDHYIIVSFLTIPVETLHSANEEKAWIESVLGTVTATFRMAPTSNLFMALV